MNSDEIQKQNDNWVPGTCVKCGKEFLFWMDATGKRCSDCDREGLSPQELQRQLANADEAFEYLVSMLPEDCTAGFVTEARKIRNR
jgi:hypothetical protein